MLDSVTWVANRDRGAEIGVSPQEIDAFNLSALDLISQIRRNSHDDNPVLLSAQVGPRGDGYAPVDRMSAESARSYHMQQIKTLAQTDVDLISGFTICYPEEAIGIVQAAQACNLPVAISFTVETDGHLPTGMSLGEAIEMVDAATDQGALYFLVNCAHPDHVADTFVDAPRLHRLRGLVANASRCSHAELDDSDELDDGNPEELGLQMGDLRKRFPHFSIFGGCCGTDMRHMKAIADQVASGE